MAAVTTKTMILPLSKRLTEMGGDVTWAFDSKEYDNYMKDVGFKVVNIPIKRKFISIWHLTAIWKLYQIIKTDKYHIVHCHTPVASVIGRLAAKMAGVPIILYTMHGSYFDEPPLFRWFFITVERMLSGFNSFVFTINQADADDLVRYRIMPSNKVQCQCSGACGINLQRFNPGKYTSQYLQNLRSELNIPGNTQVLGFVGRMVTLKGILDLLEAFRAVVRNHDNVILLMVGDVLESERDQKGFQEFKRQVEHHGLQNKVLYTGFRDNVEDLYAVMDILILPSHSEWFGMVIAEAGALGKVSVVTATRGGRQAVENGVTGLLVPIRDTAKMAGAINWLLENPQEAQKMGAKAKERVEEMFSEERVLSIVLSIYQRLISEIFNKN